MSKQEICVTNIIEPWQLQEFYDLCVQYKGLPNRQVSMQHAGGKIELKFEAFFEDKGQADEYFNASSKLFRSSPKQDI